MKKRCIIILLLLFIPILGVTKVINLSHLDFLRTSFDIDGKICYGWYVYSRPSPDNIKYIKIEANEEGASCVDDVARVAILYSMLLKLEPENATYITRLKEALNFILSLQDENGDLYNFVSKDGKINRFGVTSRKSGGWWAARGFWAIAEAMHFFKTRDGYYYSKLKKSSYSLYNVLKSNLRYGLLHGYSDMSSIFLLGLSNLYSATGDKDIPPTASMVANAIIRCQSTMGPFSDYFPTRLDKGEWHGWGSRQMQALAVAGRVFSHPEWIRAAERCALNFASFLIPGFGPIYSFNPSVISYPKIAYAMEPLVSGYTELYRATNDKGYAILAAISASWFPGNNELKEPMYDLKTGRGYDGLEKDYINKDSGTESTVCSLIALADILELPEEYSNYLKLRSIEAFTPIVLEAELMNPGLGELNAEVSGSAGGKAMASLSDDELLKQKLVLKKGDYSVYCIFDGSRADGHLYYLLHHNKGNVEVRDEKKHMVKLPSISIDKDGKYTFVIKYRGRGEVSIDQVLVVPNTTWRIFRMDKIGIALIYGNDVDLSAFTSGNIETLWERNKVTIKRFILNPNLVEQAKERKEIVMKKAVTFEETKDFTILDISSFFNNDGIASFKHPRYGNFDNHSGIYGATYPLEELQNYMNENGRLEVDDIPFVLKGLEGHMRNNTALQGEKIYLPEGRYSYIYFLGSSEHGSFRMPVTFEYSDGSRQTDDSGFSDWCQGPQLGEKIACKMPYRYDSNGSRQSITCYLFMQTLKLAPKKELITILLPRKNTMHIFAITLRKSVEGKRLHIGGNR